MTYDERENLKKKILLAFVVAFFAFLVLVAHSQASGASYPSEFHDPSLDTLNNNLTILDADLNGNFEQLDNHLTNNMPSEFMRRGEDRNRTNLNTALSKSGYTSTITTNPPTVVINGQTNMGAMAEALGGLLGGLSNQVGTVRGKSEIYGTNDGAGLSLVTNNIVLYGPTTRKLADGETIYVGTTFNHEMSFGSFGDWAAANVTLARTCKWVILGFTLGLYFFRFSEDVKKSVSESLNQRQVQGSQQAAIGNNLSAVTAIAYATAVTAAILTAAGAVLAMGTSSILGDFTMLDGSPVGTGAVGTIQMVAHDFFWAIPYFTLLSAWVPAWNIIVLHFYYLFARTFLIWPTFQTVRMLIYWLPV